MLLVLVSLILFYYIFQAYISPRSYLNRHTEIGEYDFHLKKGEYKKNVKKHPDQYRSTDSEDGYSMYDVIDNIQLFYSGRTNKYENEKPRTLMIYNEDYHVFGIHLGDEITSADNTLKRRGFKYADRSTNIAYTKGKITIYINANVEYEREIIFNMWISIDNQWTD